MTIHLQPSPTQQKYGILQLVPSELSNLFNLMELDFCPLTLTKDCQVSLDSISNNPDIAQYVPVLKEVIVGKFIMQVGVTSSGRWFGGENAFEKTQSLFCKLTENENFFNV